MTSELCGSWDVSSRFDVWWKPTGEHGKATERPIGQVTQRLNVALAKLVQQKSCSRAFEETWLLNA